MELLIIPPLYKRVGLVNVIEKIMHQTYNICIIAHAIDKELTQRYLSLQKPQKISVRKRFFFTVDQLKLKLRCYFAIRPPMIVALSLDSIGL